MKLSSKPKCQCRCPHMFEAVTVGRFIALHVGVIHFPGCLVSDCHPQDPCNAKDSFSVFDHCLLLGDCYHSSCLHYGHHHLRKEHKIEIRSRLRHFADFVCR